MTNIPTGIATLFDNPDDPDRTFHALMPVLTRELGCHRCLLFLREPRLQWSICAHGWWDRPEHGFARDKSWRRQPANLPEIDPMFAEALRNPAALFIDDIETAGPAVLNLEYERRDFGHRALIHAPIYHGGLCYGVLEPCSIDRPQVWTARDRGLIAWLQRRLGPLAAAYVAANAPK
ncbi:MAG: GAF domain-containing protein [Dongiaceae bacterium]